MSSEKKGKQSKKGPQKPKTQQVQAVRQLKALVIADSFDEQFRPITFEKPRALLPVVGVPLLKYTLEFLATAKVDEVIVFCCSKSDELTQFIEQLNNDPRALGIPVTPIINKDTKSVGEALRGVRQSELIRDDFILVYGDIVSNIEMGSLVQEHLDRCSKDKSAVMTLLLSKRYGNRHLKVYSKNNEPNPSMLVGIDEDTGQILYCEDKMRKSFNVSKKTFFSSRRVSFYNDLIESGIAICSPELLTLFEDNFDYQLLSQMVKGVVNGEEVIERKVYARVVGNKHYTSRVSNLDQYHQVTRDILTRYSYPFVPDNNFDSTSYSYLRGRYQETNVKLSKSCVICGYSSIGKYSSVEDGSSIVSSTIGRNCKIGYGVTIKNSHLWDNIVVEDNVTIENAIICSGVYLSHDSVIENGSIVSFNVHIGPGIRIPEFSRITLPNVCHDTQDEEMDDSDVFFTTSKIDLGNGSFGLTWTIEEVEESDDEEEEEEVQNEIVQMTDIEKFKVEIEETLARAIEKNISIENLVSELNALKFAFDKSLEECASCVFIALLKHVDKSNILVSLSQLLSKWSSVVTNFSSDVEAQIELLFSIQEFYADNADFKPHFENTLFQLYDRHKVLSEEAISEWEQEVMDDEEDEEGKTFVKACSNFLNWLKDNDEEDDEEDDEEYSEDEDSEDF